MTRYNVCSAAPRPSMLATASPGSSANCPTRWRTALIRSSLASRCEPGDGHTGRDRRLGPPRLRQRSAVRVQPRPEAQGLFGPDSVMGPPFSDLNPQGRRVLRVQGPRRGGRCDRTADRMESGDGLTSRSSTGARLARHSRSPRVQDDNRHSRPWVRQRPDLRRVRVPWHSSDHSIPRDASRESWQGIATKVRARNLDVRGIGREARRVEVALPDQRMLARFGVDQG